MTSDLIVCSMAQKHTSAENTIPRFVVKIIGSKQVKQFIEEPQQGRRVLTNEGQDPPVGDASHEKYDSPPEKQTRMLTGSGLLQQRGDSGLWAAINQVPDRLCVTAPSGDRSWSYIHPKIQHDSKPSAQDLEPPEQAGVFGPSSEAELSSAVRDELCDWQLSTLTSVEDESTALDLTFCGMLSQPEITHLFLKHDVPLKFPTFSRLLQMFSDKNDPAQIDYKNLLQFIRSSAFPEQPCRRGAEQGQS